MDVAGVPFTVTSSTTDGGGANTQTLVVAVTTANRSPHSWSESTNWSTGDVPANGDDVILKDSAKSILYGLAQSAVTLASLTIEKSFTGKLGLNRVALATSVDGETTTSDRLEYRDLYLAIGADVVSLGAHFGSGSPSGSGRILLDLGSAASDVEVHSTASSSADSGRPAVRLKANSISTNVYVRSAPGGVGIATEVPGEASVVGTVSISDSSAQSRVIVGPGCTLDAYEQRGGTNILSAAATLAAVTVNGGTLSIEGDFTITTLHANGGTVNDAHSKTGGNAITALNISGGTWDGSVTNRPRTLAAVNLVRGTYRGDGSAITITALNEPAGLGTVTIS